jgi:hypothetical protein
MSEEPIKLVEIRVSTTDEELVEMMAGMAKALSSATQRRGFVLTVGGYDDDPRELDQIPEVVNLLKRIYSTGLIAFLEGFTMIEKLTNPLYFQVGFGAFEVWHIAKYGPLTTMNSIKLDRIKEFTEEWINHNAIASSWMAKTNKYEKFINQYGFKHSLN